MTDLSKTPLTQSVTRDAVAWLDAAGFKPVETEVRVRDGWIADVASAGRLTPTECSALKILPKPLPWTIEGRDECDRQREERHHTYGAIPRFLTAIIEVKVSRSDFIGDGKLLAEPHSHLGWLAIPNGLDVMPHDSWGILRQRPDGGLRMVRAARINQFPAESLPDFLYSLAVQRDHATRHERLRQLQKDHRDQTNKRRRLDRLSKAVRCVLSLANGNHTTVDESLAWYGIKPHEVPKYLREELERLIPENVTA